MSIISDSDITFFVRSLIGEATAKYWTPEEVAIYIKFGMMAVESKYWYLLAPLDKKKVVKSLVANQPYIILPDDCAKVLKVEVASTGDMLRYIDEIDFSAYEEYDDGAAANSYLSLFYLKHKSSITEFPEPLRPLIAIEAVVFARTKDESVDSGLMVLQNKFEDIAISFLSVAQSQEPAMMDSYAIEDRYTSVDPIAWSFREGKIYLYKARVTNE